MTSKKLVCVLWLLLVGCGSSESVDDRKVSIRKAAPLGSEDKSSQTTRESKERLIGGIKFEIPASWQENALSNSIILAEFSLPGDAGPGRLTLSTVKGGTAANIDLWKQQVRRGPSDAESTESTLTVAGKESVYVDLHGTFTTQVDGRKTPKDNYELVGVTIPVGGEINYFIKLTGPRETISARRAEFMKFVQSARFE